MPSTSRSIRTIVRRRRSKAWRISSTTPWSPVSAAIAARWETLATLEVACDCMFAAAFTASAGPCIQPTRQPVMA